MGKYLQQTVAGCSCYLFYNSKYRELERKREDCDCVAAVAARKLLENKFIKRFILEDVCIAKVGCSIIIYYLRFSLFLMGVMFRLGHLNKKKEIKTPEKTPPLPTLSQLQPPRSHTSKERDSQSSLVVFEKRSWKMAAMFFQPSSHFSRLCDPPSSKSITFTSKE